MLYPDYQNCTAQCRTSVTCGVAVHFGVQHLSGALRGNWISRDRLGRGWLYNVCITTRWLDDNVLVYNDNRTLPDLTTGNIHLDAKEV